MSLIYGRPIISNENLFIVIMKLFLLKDAGFSYENRFYVLNREKQKHTVWTQMFVTNSTINVEEQVAKKHIVAFIPESNGYHEWRSSVGFRLVFQKSWSVQASRGVSCWCICHASKIFKTEPNCVKIDDFDQHLVDGDKHGLAPRSFSLERCWIS